MIDFRIRDAFWVGIYRLLAFRFGSFGKRVRFERPLHIVGARFIHIEDGADIQNGGYFNCTPVAGGAAPELRFGRGTHVGHHAHIVCASSVTIGERALLADRVFIADNSHEYRDITGPILDQPIYALAPTAIGAGSWIGENACVIGCRVGRNCVVAANSVVTRDVPDYCVVAGAPAAIVKRFCLERQQWLRTTPGGDFVS